MDGKRGQNHWEDQQINSKLFKKKKNNISASAGLLRRFFAFVVDLFILGLFGSLIGIFWGEFLFSLNEFAWIVGFIISSIYFSYFQTAFSKGQTIGAKLFKISVVNNKGKYLTFKDAFIRIFLLLLIVYGSEITTSMWLNFSLGSNLIIEQITGAISIAYFATFVIFLFFHPQRRGIHDLLSGAYVINNKQFNELSQTEKQKYFKDIGVNKPKKISFVVVVIICIVFGIFSYINPFKNSFFNDLLVLRDAILKSTDVKVNSVMIKNFYTSDKPVKVLEITVSVNRPTFIDKDKLKQLNNEIIKLADEKYLKNNEVDSVQVIFISGYKLGFFNYYEGVRGSSIAPKDIK